MINIGITGQSGFVGTHISNNINFLHKEFKLIPFKDEWFDKKKNLDNFVNRCNVIIHLAGVNRDKSEDFIYNRNIEIAEILINSLYTSDSKTHLIFSSSTQEFLNNPYGKSKMIARKKFFEWSKKTENTFTGLIIPNLFGPFGKPNYNSVIATFCYQIIEGKTPKVIDDKKISLLYIQNLAEKVFEIIIAKKNAAQLIIKPQIEIKVSQILEILFNFKLTYIKNGIIPDLKNVFYRDLFNTLRSYIKYPTFFPKLYKNSIDERGKFTELIKSNCQGQFSYSTTNKGFVRGNHFHTRKIERFSVISGKALIKIRKIDSDEIITFEIDGSNPSFVDIPIWYTHNIKNIGNTELITNFWINEFFDTNDMDTYFYEV